MDVIGKYLSQLTAPRGGSTSSGRRGSVESCEESDGSPAVSSLYESVDHGESQDVTKQIERCLAEAKSSTLHCQVLLLPRHMTTRVGQDVLRSSADEPCGIRGAAIQVYVESKDGLKPAGSVRPDPSLTPTFELSLIFRAEQKDGWTSLKHIFDTSRVMKLRAEYRLVKRKLYSSASPVIRDFS